MFLSLSKRTIVDSGHLPVLAYVSQKTTSAMEAYNMNMVDSKCMDEKHVDRPVCSPLPSLAQLLFVIVITLVCFTLPLVYSLCTLRAQSSVILNLQDEVMILQHRMRRLEDLCDSAIRNQAEDGDDGDDDVYDDFTESTSEEVSTDVSDFLVRQN